MKTGKPLSDQPDSLPAGKAGLAGYLEQIKSANTKQNWIQVKRLGKIVLKNLPNLAYSPSEEYLLFRRLGVAHYHLAEYSNSLDFFYKAFLAAFRHKLNQADIACAIFMMGSNFIAIRNIPQALAHFQKVEEYYKKYGDNNPPMDKDIYIDTLLSLAYCYLYKNDTEKAREIIEEKLSVYRPDAFDGISFIDYTHLKGEYLAAAEKYADARKCFDECITMGKQINFPVSILEAKIHLALIDIMESETDSGIQTLRAVMKESRKLKLNDLFCESGLLLSKCYIIQGLPDKAVLIENRIKLNLSKLDTVWLYEKMREFEKLYRQLTTVSKVKSQIAPEILVRTLNSRYEKSPHKEIVIGVTPLMQEIWQLLEKIAPTDLPVLIQGETGTGKELIARAIHQNSLRASRSCLGFNSGAVAETLLESTLFGHAKGAFTGAIEEKKGYIELASGGTLFVDEIANMSLGMQQKLLRVMEEKLLWRVGDSKPIQIDTRFIFASNQDIEQMVKNKTFREDLFYRINAIVINLPPLRERGDDIPLLINHFLSKYKTHDAQRMTQDSQRITPDAQRLLSSYPWPGNIRELENEIKRICVLYPNAKTIEEPILSDSIRNYKKTPEPFKQILNMKEATDAFQRSLIIETISQCQGNMTQAARQLGYARQSLYDKMKQLKITPETVVKK
ncbi:MAG: sigma 54-interacting transcriptional regulator [Planctomycetes bacterium]|nr:sigma 54-interacting transcriptional regulator [Planctomycetota bacterium]